MGGIGCLDASFPFADFQTITFDDVIETNPRCGNQTGSGTSAKACFRLCLDPSDGFP